MGDSEKNKCGPSTGNDIFDPDHPNNLMGQDIFDPDHPNNLMGQLQRQHNYTQPDDLHTSSERVINGRQTALGVPRSVEDGESSKVTCSLNESDMCDECTEEEVEVGAPCASADGATFTGGSCSFPGFCTVPAVNCTGNNHTRCE